MDNLKVVLIAAIIAIHAILGYASWVEVWTYTELREATLAPATQVVMFVLVSPFGFFLMALLFLVAGLLTPPSLEHKGTARFLRDRMLRLGLPFVVYVLLVQPTLVYALRHPLGSAPGSYWDEYLGAERRLDTGPLWFVGVLLVFSVAYVAWVAVRPRRTSRSRLWAHPITVHHLVVAAVVVAPASFVIRLVYPYGGESGFSDLNLWEWPACIAVFALGVRASQEGWLTAVPDALARHCRNATLCGIVAMAMLLTMVGFLEAAEHAMGGWHWPALAFAAVEAVLTVFGSVWLLSLAQRGLSRRYRYGAVLARSAYGAFMLQTVFLLGFAVALRPVALPAEAKALLVAVAGVTCSFAAAWLLVSRVPRLYRVL